jgi:hypothetical protein
MQGATLGFDATGGGELTSQILAAMEVAASRASGSSQPGNRYGSNTYKQVYIYGGAFRTFSAVCTQGSARSTLRQQLVQQALTRRRRG